jgi:hypothetical protein
MLCGSPFRQALAIANMAGRILLWPRPSRDLAAAKTRQAGETRFFTDHVRRSCPGATQQIPSAGPTNDALTQLRQHFDLLPRITVIESKKDVAALSGPEGRQLSPVQLPWQPDSGTEGVGHERA